MAKDNNSLLYTGIAVVGIGGFLWYFFSEAGYPLRRQVFKIFDPELVRMVDAKKAQEAAANFGAWQRA